MSDIVCEDEDFDVDDFKDRERRRRGIGSYLDDFKPLDIIFTDPYDPTFQPGEW